MFLVFLVNRKRFQELCNQYTKRAFLFNIKEGN